MTTPKQRKENIRRAKQTTPAGRRASAEAKVTKFDREQATKKGFTPDLSGISKMHHDRRTALEKVKQEKKKRNSPKL